MFTNWLCWLRSFWDASSSYILTRRPLIRWGKRNPILPNYGLMVQHTYCHYANLVIDNDKLPSFHLPLSLGHTERSTLGASHYWLGYNSWTVVELNKTFWEHVSEIHIRSAGSTFSNHLLFIISCIPILTSAWGCRRVYVLMLKLILQYTYRFPWTVLFVITRYESIFLWCSLIRMLFSCIYFPNKNVDASDLHDSFLGDWKKNV